MPISQITADSIATSAVTSTKLSGGVPTRSQLPAGCILQVVQGIILTQTSTTSTSYITTGLTATITPTSATNKILAAVAFSAQGVPSQNYNVTIYRGAVNLGDATNGFGYVGSGNQTPNQNFSIMYLDSPASTSSLTYAVYVKVTGGTGYWCVGNTPSTITLMEVAA